MSKYCLKDEHFVIENYDNAKPFASFHHQQDYTEFPRLIM